MEQIKNAEMGKRSIKLFEAFSTVLEKWTWLWCDQVRPITEPQPGLSLQWQMHMESDQSRQAVVCLRSVPGFAKDLNETLLQSEEGVSPDEDAFKEMVNVLGSHLVDAFKEQGEHWRLQAPVKAACQAQAVSGPHAACLVSVSERPVEIWFWLKEKE